ncbi:hypothetical protein LCGC14_0859730 [marine sediment metagenome]|uniref:HNH nuclease domain-containing protein n=1 Tax=marine sediment metagenome TaxID=412755 RepID=A0A0F9SEV4_9ZZZZ
MPRFWASVHKARDGCWLWRNGSKRGYGGFWFVDKTILAHRFAYEHLVGPIPKDLWVLHHCDQPRCVRPDHLFLGTVLDNVRDAIRKNRWNYERRTSKNYVRGEQNHKAKLNERKVRTIRAQANHVSQAKLAFRFKVTKYAVFSVIHRLTWRHVA